jgi:RNA polymerase sigma-70 factor (ECF subfamily)
MGDSRKLSFSAHQQTGSDAYRDLFYQYHGRLVLFAHKFTGDLQVSQDIVQDAFLKLWKKSPSLASFEVPRAYLFQSVKNSCLNHIRHIKIRHLAESQIVSQLAEVEKELYLAQDDPLQSLLEQDVQRKIEEIVQSMPEKCREVFLLSRTEMLKNREIADQLGISVKMVEKQISKALLMLRTNLSEYFSVLLFLLLHKN